MFPRSWAIVVMFGVALLVYRYGLHTPTPIPEPPPAPPTMTPTPLPPPSPTPDLYRSTLLAAPLPTDQPPPNRFLFVEFEYRVTATGVLPATSVGFPEYTFDGARGTLTKWNGVPNAAWGHIGYVTMRSAPNGNSTANELRPLQWRVPLEMMAATGQTSNLKEEASPRLIALSAVDANGTLEIMLADGKHYLVPVNTSLEVYSNTASLDLPVVHPTEKYPAYKGTFKTTSTLINYGWLVRGNNGALIQTKKAIQIQKSR